MFRREKEKEKIYYTIVSETVKRTERRGQRRERERRSNNQYC